MEAGIAMADKICRHDRDVLVNTDTDNTDNGNNT